MTDFLTLHIPIKQTSSAYYARKRAAQQCPDKHCLYCGEKLVRRYNEVNGRWEDWHSFLQRQYCNASCSNKARAEGTKQEREAKILQGYKLCKEYPGLYVNYQGEFIYKGKPKHPQRSLGRHGEKLTARICITQDRRHLYFSAARLVASAFKLDYTDNTYIDYIDGDIHNISADNLRIVSAQTYHKARCTHASHSRTTNTYDYQVRRLENVITEAQAVLHYFKTEDLSKVHRHVETHLYPCLVDYSLNTLHLGTHVAREQVANAIAHFYEVLLQGHAISHPEHYCKELLYRYKQHGTFGHIADMPKPIQLLINVELKTDCLWEKYKVTHFKQKH